MAAAKVHGHRSESDEVRLIVSQTALRQISLHADSDPDRELGGVLLGTWRIADGRYVVDVTAAMQAVSEDHGPAHFTFTADTWTQIHQERAENFPQADIVGWYHTHPDLGVFFSDDDIVVHSAAFAQPWQVALVIDPVRMEGCAFAWHSAPDEGGPMDLTPLSGFTENMEQQNISMARWRYVPSPVWQPGQAASTSALRQVYGPSSEAPSLPAISPWWGVVLGGLALLISLLLLLDRLLSTTGSIR
jgi:proteasome lid subunit RPN8/RPN11